MHIEEDSIKNFSGHDSMDTEEMIAFLEHLDQCDFCLSKMLEEESLNSEISAPDYLTEQILQRAAAPDVQASRAIRSTSRKMQLFYYGLRTAAGVIAALFLLFTVQQVDFSALPVFSQSQPLEYTIKTEQKRSSKSFRDLTENISWGFSRGSDAVMDYIGSFSNKILNGGDLK